MAWKVFAEDAGTGLSSQNDADYGDGAHLNALAHHQNAKDYAVVEPTITADYTVPEATFSLSHYRVTVQNVDERDHDGDGNFVTWPEVTFGVLAPQTTLALTDSAVNYIYVNFDLTTTGDDAQYVVKTTDSAPAGPSLKVAEVDTSANTDKTVNTDPNSSVSTLQIYDSLVDPSGVSHSGELADASDLHTKTSSASELTDVSADSVSGAHHAKYTDAEALAAVEGGAPTMTTDIDASGQTVTAGEVENTDYNEAVVTHASVSGTVDINLSNGNYHLIEATGNVTITYSGVSSTPAGNSVLLYFSDSDGGGPYTISWPSAVQWPNGGSDSVVEIPASSNVRVSITTPDGGTTWRQIKSGSDFA